MEYVSFYGIFFMVPIVGLADQFKEQSVFSYLGENPQVLYLILLYTFVSAFGQVFIFRVIVHFGNLTLAIITTTRKFFTVMLSIILFSHVLTLTQWCCVGLVLSGSSLDFYTQLSNRHKPVKV
jgi:drug/metabolite transporter (DMT)-like permease